jgi:hypothetical protein
MYPGRAPLAAFLLVATLSSPHAQAHKPATSPATAAGAKPPEPAPATAAQLAAIAHLLLADGALSEAKKYCDEAGTRDRTDRDAVRCVRAIAERERAMAEALQRAKVDAHLEEATARVQGVDDKALTPLTSARGSATTSHDFDRVATAIRELPRDATSRAAAFADRFTLAWVIDLFVAVALVLGGYGLLVLARLGRRRWRGLTWRHEWGNQRRGLQTQWRLAPIEDKAEIGINGLVLDALARMRKELESDVPIPTLLPLRPVKGEPYESDVWKDFRVKPPRTIGSIHANMAVTLDQNRFDIADAVAQLQLKVAGVEVGSIARFLRSIAQWFDLGVPTISGSMVKVDLTGGITEVTVRLTRCAYGLPSLTATASTQHTNPVEAARLAAERVAFKLLYLFAEPGCDGPTVDGLAARRQGLALLQRFVTTGEDAGAARKEALEKAVHNLRFARGTPIARGAIACELHLFEGIAEGLLGNSRAAIELFRTVQELADPKNQEELLFRLQAIYNHAVLEQRAATAQSPGALARATQLYERVCSEAAAVSPSRDAIAGAITTVRFLARFGRVTAAAQRAAAEGTLDKDEMKEWLRMAHDLLHEVKASSGDDERSVCDVIMLETHKAFATISLRYLVLFRPVCYPPPVRTELVPITAQAANGNALALIDDTAADEALIARVLASLEFIVQRQVPDVRLYNLVVLAQLAARNVTAARENAREAIRLGGTSERFFFAVALGALYDRNELAAKKAADAFAGVKQIRQFKLLTEQLADRAAGEPAPTVFDDLIAN